MMKLKFPALVTVLLLASGMALASDPARAQPVTSDTAASAAAPAGAAPSVKCDQAPRATVYVPKTREEVRAGAIEAAKHQRATVLQNIDSLMH
jgi:hypothetical protein